MNGHDEFLELVAASIDFELTDEEFGRLSTHLARCPDCRRAADEIRGGAAAIAALPAPTLAPARAEQILRGALRTPPAKPRWGLLAVAAMLATLGGGILFAGFQLVNDDDTAPSEPPPSLVAEASAPPSAEPPEESADPGHAPPPDDGPPMTPNPGDDAPPPVDPGPLAFPLPYSSDVGPVRVALASDDRLWVTFTRGRDTVVARLDAAGHGRPVVEPNAVECQPFAVGDGSARALCYFDDVADPENCLDCGPAPRVYAWSAPGQSLAGFPVWLPSGISTGTNGARVIGSDLVTVTTEAYDEVVAEFGDYGSARITTVGADGSVTEGAQVPGGLRCCTIGPDGVAYASRPIDEENLETRTQVIAFDETGMRPGWPITLDGGGASNPAFGPNGQIVLLSGIDEGTRIVRLNPDGSEAAPSLDLPFVTAWDDGGLFAPLVDQRGRVWVTAGGTIHGFDEQGNQLSGFPYEPETALAEGGRVCDTGSSDPCSSWPKEPRLAPGSLIYALETGPDGKGERITVVNRDGSIRSGWPKTLQKAGAAWDSVTIGDNRTAYAVASEPESNDQASVTILAYAPNGTEEWKTTLFEP
jgi:hypothetical protein